MKSPTALETVAQLNETSQGAVTLKRCVVLPRRAVASPHWVSIGLLLHPGAVGATQQQPPYKPNGVMQQHDGASARCWLPLFPASVFWLSSLKVTRHPWSSWLEKLCLLCCHSSTYFFALLGVASNFLCHSTDMYNMSPLRSFLSGFTCKNSNKILHQDHFDWTDRGARSTLVAFLTRNCSERWASKHTTHSISLLPSFIAICHVKVSKLSRGD